MPRGRASLYCAPRLQKADSSGLPPSASLKVCFFGLLCAPRHLSLAGLAFSSRVRIYHLGNDFDPRLHHRQSSFARTTHPQRPAPPPSPHCRYCRLVSVRHGRCFCRGLFGPRSGRFAGANGAAPGAVAGRRPNPGRVDRQPGAVCAVPLRPGAQQRYRRVALAAPGCGRPGSGCLFAQRHLGAPAGAGAFRALGQSRNHRQPPSGAFDGALGPRRQRPVQAPGD